MEDCLYRFKNHATWIFPSIDIDEYINMKDGSIFDGGTVPEDYLGSSWDALVKKSGLQTDADEMGTWKTKMSGQCKKVLEVEGGGSIEGGFTEKSMEFMYLMVESIRDMHRKVSEAKEEPGTIEGHLQQERWQRLERRVASALPENLELPRSSF
eukprot:s4608_g3.t1